MKTPVEALRFAADVVQEEAHKSEGAAMRLEDSGFNPAFIAIARAEARVLRRMEAKLRAEADRLPEPERDPSVLNAEEWATLMDMIKNPRPVPGWLRDAVLADDWHYYEAHVTIAPTTGYGCAEVYAERYGFRMAKLFMPTGEPSRKDAFFTARDDSEQTLQKNMLGFLRSLKNTGYNIVRYKIESTLMDSRHDDSAFKLSGES